MAPIKFTIGAVIIDPKVQGYNPQLLTSYMASINVPFFIETDALEERARPEA